MDNPWVALVMVVEVGSRDCFDYDNSFSLMDEI